MQAPAAGQELRSNRCKGSSPGLHLLHEATAQALSRLQELGVLHHALHRLHTAQFNEAAGEGATSQWKLRNLGKSKRSERLRHRIHSLVRLQACSAFQFSATRPA